jgi:hypothetical protein
MFSAPFFVISIFFVTLAPNFKFLYYAKILSIIASVLLLCGCQNTQTQTKNDYKFLDAKKKSFENFTVYWLKDNAGDHKFPFELFGNVSDEVKKAVNMPEGMPSYNF